MKKIDSNLTRNCIAAGFEGAGTQISTGPSKRKSRRAVRPARTNGPVEMGSVFKSSASQAGLRVLIVDLNNFANFPTLAVGLLTASLRDRGHIVDVLCPLAYDAPATERERRETVIDHLKRRIHLTDWSPALDARDILRGARLRQKERPHPIVTAEVARAITAGPDVILLSAYLQHRRTVSKIGDLAKAANIPVLLGGPMFVLPEVADAWRTIPGVRAVVGAEADRVLPDMVETLVRGDDLLAFPGVTLADGRRSEPAGPLRPLDGLPTPDFTDFPWDRYPVRIIPVMTGRGCQWDKCTFCSDVISTSGRTFRTRRVEAVIREMEEQSRRHDTTNFLFLDLKLNSWPEMLRGIGSEIGRSVRGAEWIGTVHVDQRKDNGLARSDLEAAVNGGMRRVSFGLESGSQRMLDAMRKGSTVEGNGKFIRDAHGAGLSVRATMFKGFPNETADDMENTADFLEMHAPFLDRVRFNDFSLPIGTPIWRSLRDRDGGDAPLDIRRDEHSRARAIYRHRDARGRSYRRAKARALAVVHDINRQRLRPGAQQFDGLM